MSTLVTDITAADWSIKLGEPGSVVENLDDISQCIRVILTTPKGGRSHEPLFGCDLWKYIDQPMSEALPHIVAEVIAAVTMWEPRARLTKVAPSYIAPGEMTLQVEWTLKGYSEYQQTTEVRI